MLLKSPKHYFSDFKLSKKVIIIWWEDEHPFDYIFQKCAAHKKNLNEKNKRNKETHNILARVES